MSFVFFYAFHYKKKCLIRVCIYVHTLLTLQTGIYAFVWHPDQTKGRLTHDILIQRTRRASPVKGDVVFDVS